MTDSPASDGAERKEIPLPTDGKAMLLTGIFGLLLFSAGFTAPRCGQLLPEPPTCRTP